MLDKSQLVGGHPAVDLVNTVSWRGDPERLAERLPGIAELLGWLPLAGLAGAPAVRRLRAAAGRDPAAALAALRAVHRLREAAHRVVTATVDGDPPAAGDLRALQRTIADAHRHATPAPALPLRSVIEPVAPADVPRLLALAVEDLVTSPEDLAALRRCDGPACGWFFLDRSRSHTRRWCSSADCGNRDRARRHYARHR